MNMKKSLTISLAALLAAGSAYAIGPIGTVGPFCDGPGEARAVRMQQKLGLSESQTQQVEAIFREHYNKTGGLRSELQEQLSQILTATQLEEMESLRGSRGFKRGMMGGGPYGPGHGYGPGRHHGWW